MWRKGRSRMCRTPSEEVAPWRLVWVSHTRHAYDLNTSPISDGKFRWIIQQILSGTPPHHPRVCYKSFNDTPMDKSIIQGHGFLLTVNVGSSFWSCSLYELLVVLIFLPLAHVSNYRFPWVLRGISIALEVQDQLNVGFKHTELHGCGKFHDFEGPVHWVKEPK